MVIPIGETKMGVLMRKRCRAMFVLIIPVLMGFGPCTSGPRFVQIIPGGVVNGTPVTEKIRDWSFAGKGLCVLETRPEFPHSITVFCFNGGDKLYVGCRNCADKVWSGYVTNDNRARIKIKGSVYPVIMNRIAADALDQTWANLRTDADGVVALMPEGLWLFELTSEQ